MPILCAVLLLVVASPALAVGTGLPYQVAGESFTGYFVTPDSGSNKFILLIHDWDGLTQYETKRADMLAELGYTVFAADLYGTGIRPTEPAEKKKLSGALYADRNRMRSLLAGALEAAKGHGVNPADGVAMGYCFGGAAVLELARSGVPMRGFVSFHGGLTTPPNQDYTATQGGILVFHGTADASVSMLDFATLATELETARVPHEMITYAGAPHAFTVFGSERYRQDADRKSWRRFVEYLEETL
jgi:dienelactone hydrolase